MARPKGTKIKKTCLNCNQEFEVIPSLKERQFCTKPCAQQYKGKDKSWLEKREKTCIEKYGVKNAFQSDQVQETYKKNLIEKYGVSNPFLSKEIKEKAINTIQDRYGNKVASQNKEVANKISKALKNKEYPRKNFVDVKWEKILNYYQVSKMKPLFDREYLMDNKLNHKYQNKFKFQCENCGEVTEVFLSNGYLPSCKCSDFYGYSLVEEEILVFISGIIGSDKIYTNRRDILPNRLELDMFIPSYKLAIEVNGVYWHSESMGKYRDYHLFKTEKCLEKDIELIHILDFEWIYKKPIIQSIIRNKIQSNQEKKYARKCVIKEIEDIKLVRNFLNSNHIQGYTHASINLGLYEGENLVSIMTFSKNRFKKNSNEWEMVRFCNLLNTNVVGAASKLFKHFNKHFNNDNLPIISFSDRRFFNGNLYKTLGFEFNKNTTPSYIYWKDSKVLNRMSCQKHKLPKLLENFDVDKSEYQNMIANGWKRVWDSGNTKWMFKG